MCVIKLGSGGHHRGGEGNRELGWRQERERIIRDSRRQDPYVRQRRKKRLLREQRKIGDKIKRKIVFKMYICAKGWIG